VVGVFFFAFFKAVPSSILTIYGYLVTAIGPVYAIFEIVQLTNITFAISRNF